MDSSLLVTMAALLRGGPTGPTGPRGATGATGAAGATGATGAAGAGGAALLTWSTNDTAAGLTTYYPYPGFNLQANLGAVQHNVGYVMTRACQLQRLTFHCVTPPSNSNMGDGPGKTTVTVMKNGVATALVVSVEGGPGTERYSAQDDTHTETAEFVTPVDAVDSGDVITLAVKHETMGGMGATKGAQKWTVSVEVVDP